jgi:hypothetical protein
MDDVNAGSAPAPAGLPAALDLLRELGADGLEHPGGSLLAHLVRVRERLAGWGARPDLQSAGLCHALYGTDGFAESLLPAADTAARRRAADVIGLGAEELVYFYAACDRSASYPSLADPVPSYRDRFSGRTWTPSPQRCRDLAELTAANELDLVDQSPGFRERWSADLRALFTRFGPLLSEAARRDCRIMLAG